MKSNSIPLGGIGIIDKVEKDFGLVSSIFRGVGGRAKDFLGITKLLLYNRLTHSVSVHQILETNADETFELLGMKDPPSERSIYRTLERIGKLFPVLHGRYKNHIKKHNLVSEKQIADFSSSYLEGNKTELAKHGHSRDRRPDKPQVNFGISTGINDIPSALTIDSGNTTDHEQIRKLIRVASKICTPGTLYMFDAGGNSATTKKLIRKLECNYLTLKPKKIKTYKKYVRKFKIEDAKPMLINDRAYFCIKIREGVEFKYLYFCEELWEDQMRIKERKFKRQKEKGNKTLKKRKHLTLPSDKGWVEFIPSLQGTISEIEDPYVTGIEGFFILESSVDADPETILRLYKDRDKAEKFIRDMKEGIEMRPLRHWSKWALIGAIFISFLAKVLINLTLTVVYPKNAFRVLIVSNISPPVKALFDDFLDKYGQKELNLRW